MSPEVNSVFYFVCGKVKIISIRSLYQARMAVQSPFIECHVPKEKKWLYSLRIVGKYMPNLLGRKAKA